MERKQFVYNIFAVFLLFGIAYAVTQAALPIRQVVTTSQKIVAGASTQQISEELVLPQELTSDLSEKAEGVKKSLLEIQLSHVIGFISQAGKIIQDVKSLQPELEKRIDNL